KYSIFTYQKVKCKSVILNFDISPYVLFFVHTLIRLKDTADVLPFKIVQTKNSRAGCIQETGSTSANTGLPRPASRHRFSSPGVPNHGARLLPINAITGTNCPKWGHQLPRVSWFDSDRKSPLSPMPPRGAV